MNDNGSSSFDDGDCPTFIQNGTAYDDENEDGGPRITVWRHLSRTERALARQLSRETTKQDREESEVEKQLQKAERTGVLASFEQLKASMPLRAWEKYMAEAKAWMESEIGGFFEITLEKLMERESRRETPDPEKLQEKQVLATGSAIADIDFNAEADKIIEALTDAIHGFLDKKDA